MRTLILSLGVLAFASGAGAQVFTLNPQSLEGWTVTGADRSKLAQSGVLTLPATAQVVRPFPAGNIAVAVVTKPLFGDGAEDWPTLELGSTTLVFTRDGNVGRLLLVIGDRPPEPLPLSIPLDADGRSVEPVALILEHKAGAIMLNANGQVLRLSADPGTTTTEDVILSAGLSHAWTVDEIQVVVSSQTGPDDLAKSGLGSKSSSDNNAGLKDSAPGVLGTLLPVVAGNNATPDNTVKPSPESSGSTGGLEVFTPPSVRFGRTDAVRAALANPKNK